ncbi:MAG: ribosome-associated translation inhibitor RaiA [Rickettsiales bacterium]|nr:ribosome-associated translation inhibitor RaiA [Rickettsiales bacterium]
MQIRVTGAGIEVGQSLTEFVEENLERAVKKYFENAVDAEVHFSKDGNLFKVMISVNEGVKGGIAVKSNASGGDVYGCFNEACEKAAKQLRRYKRRLVNYRRQAKSIKDQEPDYTIADAKKYILPPLSYDVFEEMEEEVIEEEVQNQSHNVINEKHTAIEKLTVDEAIMKMDLADLPALVFVNIENNRLNVVYHRKDGNISWIDPEV